MELGAFLISETSHALIIDEFELRDRLDYDEAKRVVDIPVEVVEELSKGDMDEGEEMMGDEDD